MVGTPMSISFSSHNPLARYVFGSGHPPPHPAVISGLEALSGDGQKTSLTSHFPMWSAPSTIKRADRWGGPSPTMASPRKPPDGEPNKFPGKRYPYWVRRSDHHPRVESRPGEIIDGTNAIIQNLRSLRSPSPDAREFSRFLLRPCTPHTSMSGSTSQRRIPTYPPSPPPTTRPHQPPPPLSHSHPHMAAVGVPSQFPTYLYPIPSQPPPHFQYPYPPPTRYPPLPPPPTIHPPPPPPPPLPPSGGGSQGQRQRGKCDFTMYFTGLLTIYRSPRANKYICFVPRQ